MHPHHSPVTTSCVPPQPHETKPVGTSQAKRIIKETSPWRNMSNSCMKICISSTTLLHSRDYTAVYSAVMWCLVIYVLYDGEACLVSALVEGWVSCSLSVAAADRVFLMWELVPVPLSAAYHSREQKHPCVQFYGGECELRIHALLVHVYTLHVLCKFIKCKHFGVSWSLVIHWTCTFV